VSWQSGSQQIAVMFAASVGVVLNSILSLEQMERWVGVFLCFSAASSFLFSSGSENPSPKRMNSSRASIIRARRRFSLLAANGASSWSARYGHHDHRFVLHDHAYTPTFGNSVLHLASTDSLVVTLCVGASNLFWLPIMGALSDRIGRRPLLFVCTVLMLVTAYPAMLWLVREPSFARLPDPRAVAFLHLPSYTARLVVFLTEIMPSRFAPPDCPRL